MDQTTVKSQKLAFPVLGRGSHAQQRIVLIAPYHTEVSRLTCHLYAADTLIKSQVAEVEDTIVRLYRFEFEGLTAGVTYKYLFESDGQFLDLGGGLESDDLYFSYWDSFGENDAAILMSCNGIFDFKGDTDQRWAMWDRLYDEVSKMPSRPKIAFLGGDQYYQDCVEEVWIGKVGDEEFPQVKDEFKRASLENALKHMSRLSYRKFMAQITTVAMMDDHDLTDGAGGRSEYFVGDGFSANWNNYVSVQLELFRLLQASRNPAPVIAKPNSAFSFVLDMGQTALVAVDLRSEKNSRSKTNPLMMDDHLEAVEKAFENLPHKNVMVLVPVVPLRNSMSLERTLVDSAKIANQIFGSMESDTWLKREFKKGLKYAAGLEDDISDALASECNGGYFARLLRIFAKGVQRGVTYTILSGDIHTGGSIETSVEVNNVNYRLPILVSSAIGYSPMPQIVEAVLREPRLINFERDGVKVTACNNAFTVNRNFMLLFPERLAGTKKNFGAFLFQEGVSGCKAVAIESWMPDTEDAFGTPKLFISRAPEEHDTTELSFGTDPVQILS